MVDPITLQAEMLGAFTKSVHKALGLRTTKQINVTYIPTTGFSGYYAYQNRGTLAVTLLGLASAYSVIQAFIAWSKVLNK